MTTTTRLDGFRVVTDAGLETIYEATADVVGTCMFRDGTKAHTSGHVEGGAVLVMLDVDGEGYTHVQVDSRGKGWDLLVVEGAITHLQTVAGELLRLARDYTEAEG